MHCALCTVHTTVPQLALMKEIKVNLHPQSIKPTSNKYRAYTWCNMFQAPNISIFIMTFCSAPFKWFVFRTIFPSIFFYYFSLIFARTYYANIAMHVIHGAFQRPEKRSEKRNVYYEHLRLQRSWYDYKILGYRNIQR